jgi:FtsH-binding integral membrane protein
MATRCLSLAAALSTLALMVSAARPWGAKDAYQDWRGYAGFSLLAVWAILPYLGMLLLGRRAEAAKAGEILILAGALIITGGGLAAYADAVWLHPDPQGGLAFSVVPFYQVIILGLLAVLLWLAKKYQERKV